MQTRSLEIISPTLELQINNKHMSQVLKYL